MRRFVVQRFPGRLFSDDHSHWVVVGGATAVWVTEHTGDEGNTPVTGYWRHR